ncbi:MAG: SDR family oxidoreductase [Betaproteobacteria bacterium]|nr:SDR family oxidoreductase [Betaproteobacteria bacterium]
MVSRLLDGDIALVTGAASGIGRGIAVQFAREGASVVMTDLPGRGGEETAAALTAEGASVRFVPSDLSLADAPDRLLREAFGSDACPSVLVHAASPRRHEKDHAAAVDLATWDEMVTVNLRSGFALGRNVALEMRRRRIPGRMLFVTSLHAHSPRNLPHYSASKAGQTMVVKELARAFGPDGIRVNAIAPGAIPGGGFDAGAAGVDRLVRCTSLRRLGTPEDIAGMAVALVSERFSAYVTGTTVVVDGGLALHNWIEPVA